MSAIAMGGGSGAVASSAHAACARFRGTDPLITHRARRALAASLGAPDVSGRIPEARWVRAMTFEALVRNRDFASRIATTTVGALGLPRPEAVTIVNAAKDVAKTRGLLEEARERALSHRAATLIHTPAVPYPGFDASGATPVLPDFVVVAPKAASGEDASGAWLIVGDAKDYERVRSRIEDARMLKGYIQVAFGAEAFDEWADLPSGLAIHRFGVLAVPRNSFLQPTAVTEDLTDHREEVRMRLAEKRAEAEHVTWTGDPTEFVSHLVATFDPATCPTCSLFAYCRNELRESDNPADLLVELGVPADVRPLVIGLVDGTGVAPTRAPTSTVAMIEATLSGRPGLTGQRRIDPVGLPGTVNVVLAKADSAALGVHGIATQSVGASGAGEWAETVFAVPQSDDTRRRVAGIVGAAVADALEAVGGLASPTPIHLVVPDAPTGDLLASIADVLAGVEISRLRWERDVEQSREPLTFDGQLATIPAPLTPEQRLGVSFLLENDRGRAFALRSTVVDLRATLNGLFVAGGPASNSGRLDYLVGWAEAVDPARDPIDHREFSDAIEFGAETPGARLSNSASDGIHQASRGSRRTAVDPEEYDRLVREALRYRTDTFDRAVAVLESFSVSNLRDAYRAIEGSAQAVWRRCFELQASDLIRFGLTTRYWRNTLVQIIEDDGRCDAHLTALGNPQWADGQARDAGNGEMLLATVVSTDPLVLDVVSRRVKSGDRVALLHVNGRAAIEDVGVSFQLFGGHIAVKGLASGPLAGLPDQLAPGVRRMVWAPNVSPQLVSGDELVLIAVDANKYGLVTVYNGSQLNIPRPRPDQQMAPKATCTPESYVNDREKHRWCCQPHLVREAEISDQMAKRREAGELNPQTWPPVLDADAFDVAGTAEETADSVDADVPRQPDGITVDDLE